MSWDPFQQDVLAELGHVLYRQAGAASPDQAVQVAPPSAAVEGIGDPMLARVARAAGMSIEQMRDCVSDMQVIASLRGNPAAKRALWPRLRAWRKQQQ